ncbi:MAG: hypothetical protein IJ424_06685 [Oscillospiraceae bacterium]|nr:hypothetical protein [Oscillospiraceae bacterium]
MDEGKNKSPYHGFWAILFAIVFMTLFINVIVFTILLNLGGKDTELNLASAKAIGFGLSVVFYVILFISGVFDYSMSIVGQRISEFFSNLQISFGFAVKNYFWDIKHNGVAFLIYFIFMLTGTLVFIDGLRDALEIISTRY